MVVSPEYFHEIVKVSDCMITCPPVHSQWAALATFEIYDEWTAKVRNQLEQRRNFVVDKLSKYTQYIDFNIP